MNPSDSGNEIDIIEAILNTTTRLSTTTFRRKPPTFSLGFKKAQLKRPFEGEDTTTLEKKNANKENITAWGSPVACRRSTRLFAPNPTDKEHVAAWGSPVTRRRSIRLFVANPDPLSAAGSLHGEIAGASVSPIKKKARREVMAMGSPKVTRSRSRRLVVVNPGPASPA
ncbi:hypothetical protein B0H17DRAFT_1205250 [Mycena rosella]|uniref:Uncharacterized protein n=1 Tax=Mycena rosella TaxID=1033263 RepID=A0AAD7GEZ8_MYCRO|nr:hypothetical protein B0H17DRAFT_1205250 [Mycena rosella]